MPRRGLMPPALLALAACGTKSSSPPLAGRGKAGVAALITRYSLLITVH
jgi:hypothetical protein